MKPIERITDTVNLAQKCEDKIQNDFHIDWQIMIRIQLPVDVEIIRRNISGKLRRGFQYFQWAKDKVSTHVSRLLGPLVTGRGGRPKAAPETPRPFQAAKKRLRILRRTADATLPPGNRNNGAKRHV